MPPLTELAVLQHLLLVRHSCNSYHDTYCTLTIALEMTIIDMKLAADSSPVTGRRPWRVIDWESYRDDSTCTRSPTRHSLRSSCAMSFVVRFCSTLYFGRMTHLSIATRMLLSALSETTCMQQAGLLVGTSQPHTERCRSAQSDAAAIGSMSLTGILLAGMRAGQVILLEQHLFYPQRHLLAPHH